MVRRSGIEGAEHQIPKMERRCGVRNSPPDEAEVRCAEHQIRVRCPALLITSRPAITIVAVAMARQHVIVLFFSAIFSLFETKRCV